MLETSFAVPPSPAPRHAAYAAARRSRSSSSKQGARATSPAKPPQSESTSSVRLPASMNSVGLALLAAALLAVALAALGAPLVGEHAAVGDAGAAVVAAEHLRDVGVGALLDTLPDPLRKSILDNGFFAAFSQSLLLILACELGDRTFFVAAVLAMKAPRIIVFGGAIAALALMTVLSALIGKAFPMIIDKQYTAIASALLFAYFGLQLLRDWWKMRNQPDTENEELAEVEEELDKSGRKPALSSSLASIPFIALISPVFIKAFSMTALAEWGDRSQIATIALAAAQNIYGVIAGGVIGHAVCTSLAVIGGRLLATRISEKAVALTGGLLFLSFAVLTFFGKLE